MIPYSLNEIELVIKEHDMNRYHKELMIYMLNRIKDLEYKNSRLEEKYDELLGR